MATTTKLNTARLNNYGYPYLPIPEEFFADLSLLEDPKTLNESTSFEDFMDACKEYEDMREWVESYYYEQYGPAPVDEEFDPEHIDRLFERLDLVAERIYAVEKSPQILAETLQRLTPEDASNDEWALYAIVTDPVSIGIISGHSLGYSMLMRQLSLAGSMEEALLVYAPVWFPTWLYDVYVRHPYTRLGSDRPTSVELSMHTAALKLWTPHLTTHVFHDYRTAYKAVQKSWQRTQTNPM